MATVIGARSNENRDIQVVAVTAVNIPERKAECMTRIRSMIYVDISYPVGGIYITPSVGDQWYVERIDTIWRLFGRIPFNDNNIQVDAVEGQQVFGGTGPVVMNGSTLDIRSPLQMNPVPDDEMPDPADMPPGTIIYSETQGLVVSDGSGEWVPTGGVGGDIEDIEGLTELLDNKIDKPLVPLVPGTGTKISYDENGLVIGGDDADITDITDLDAALEGKSDVGHGHTEAEIINLEIDLASKAAVDHTHSEDGAALDPDLVDIGALTPANLDFIQRVAGHWTNVPPSTVKGGLNLDFLDIGGILDDLQIPLLDCTKIDGGTFLPGQIPELTPDWITGIFDPAQIPTLTPDWISGIFDPAQIPTLTPDWISGIFDPAQIPELTPDWISGIFDPTQIPDLSADKITSGILDLFRIPGLDLTRIPDLPAGKITEGTFLDELIPNLHTSKITSGVFNLFRIPGLDLSRIPELPTSKITEGTFPQSMLDITNIASSIVNGTFLAGQIPEIDVTKIIGGPFTTGMIPDLNANKITSGTFADAFVPGLASRLLTNVFNKSVRGGSNLVISPDFEDNTILRSYGAKSGSDSGYSTEQSHSGAQSFKIVISGPDYCWLGFTPVSGSQPYWGGSPDFISVHPGERFYGELWVHPKATNTVGATDGLHFNALFSDSKGLLGYDYSSAFWRSNTYPHPPSGTWTKISGYVTVPPGYDQLWPYVQTVPGMPDGNVYYYDDATIREVTEAQNIVNQLFGGSNILSNILPANVPEIDVTKIIGGPFTTDMIPGLTTDWITEGTFPQSMLDITSIASDIVTGAFNLDQIPSLPTSKITEGTFPQSMLDITSIAAGIISGTLGVPQIPDLSAGKITSGVFDLFRIPGLDLSRIPAMDLPHIPNLPAGKITEGTFLDTLIPNLNADKISSGEFDLLRIPGLPAGKITGGTFAQSMIANLPTDLGSIFTTITSPTRPDLLQNVPVSSIGQVNPEMLVNPGYEGLGSVFGGTSSWVHDPTVSHTVGGTGSAKVTANGTVLQLLSDPPIPVSPDQVLAVSHWLRWSGVTAGAGMCFKLAVNAYLGNGISNTTDIQTIASPGATGGWVQLAGNYTVPASGVDNIRLQLTVSAAVTAGTVWWDDGSVKKTQLLKESWTAGLVGDLGNLLTGIGARVLITDHTDLLSTLGLGTPTLTAITNRLTNLTSGGLFNAANLNNTNNIPMLLPSRMTGIGGIADIGSSLQQTWDKVAGASAGAGTLPAITTRLGNLNASGLFNAGSLFNLLGMGELPFSLIPELDGTRITTGKVPIGQLPIGNLPTELNRISLPDVGQTLDQITNAFIGEFANPFTSTDPNQARQSMDSIYREFLGLSQKMQDIRSSQAAVEFSGKSVTFNWAGIADAPAPTEFTVTETGPGTSHWGIKNGGVGWRVQANNGNRTATVVYNVDSTASDFQIIRATLSGAPPGDNGGSKPRIYGIGRVDNPANPQNYVWCRGYNDGFLTYKGDFGCTIAGVDYVWHSGVPLTWSMDINIIVGVGGNPRRYQVFSGTELVKDFIEPGTSSKINNGTTDPPKLYRYWGCKSELKTDSGKVIAPPFIVGTSVSDNQPPAVVGSTFRAYRASTGSVNFNGWNKTPNNFFDTPAYRSSEMLWDGTNLTVGIEGTYLVNIRYATSAIPQGDRADVSVFRNNAAIRKMGGAFGDSYFAAEGNMFGMALVYLKVNDVLCPGYSVTAATTVNGEPGGTDTFFEVTLVNRSTA